VDEVDYSKLKSIADEPHWNDFVQSIGGQLVASMIKRQGVKNADYLFPANKVVAELKILETEFAHTAETLARIQAAVARHPGVDPEDPSKPLRREILNIIRAPLQRIIKKANRQIKETKQELKLVGWDGLLILVNDEFRGAPPALVRDLCGSILAGTSYSSIGCFIYLTNHYVELPDNPYACLMWAPMYAPDASDDLLHFVNDLGRKWRLFVSDIEGPFDYENEQDDIDFHKIEVVTGPFRRLPYRYPGDE
jgi:hypothetical protein